MDWKRRMRRNLLFALFGGVAANVIYFGLEFTTLHRIAAIGLGPAVDLVWHHLDPNCYARSHCYLEEFAVNIILYVFWIFILLMGIDLLGHLKRRMSP